MKKISIYFIFFLSGFSALIYQVVWARMFGSVFGNTVYAASIVLAAFMGGLSMGSLIGGKMLLPSSRALPVYAFIEAGIALTAFLFPYFLGMADILYSNIFHSFESIPLLHVARFVISFFLLMLPTTLMGATLPVLSVYFADKEDTIGKLVGRLYAFNTLGAVMGCSAVGFYLINRIGLSGSLYLAAAINVLSAVLAILLNSFKKAPAKIPFFHGKVKTNITGEIKTGSEKIMLFLFLYGLCGFTSLAYEVIWTRILLFALGTKAYAFSLMLLIFLLGIALGSFFASLIVKRIKNPVSAFSWMELSLGGIMILNLYALHLLPVYHSKLMDFFVMDTWFTTLAYKLFIPVVFLLPSTFLMGAIFPVITKICSVELRHIGRDVGRLYSTNTFGAILGSLAAGFLLIPLVGTQRTLLFLAFINFAIGGIAFMSERKAAAKNRNPAFIPLLVIFLVLSFIAPDKIVASFYNIRAESSRLLYSKDGVSGTITVHQYPDFKVVSVDSVNVAGTFYPLRTTQKIQGHLPALLHYRPKEVLQIGFGSGETCRVLTLYEFERIDLVEINPEVIKVSNRFFREINEGATTDKRFNAIFMDGKNYLKLTEKKYDLILNDATYPGLAGSSSLYTLDHFKAGRKRLKKNGLFSSWLPLDIQPDQFDIVLRTFAEAFPYSSLWLANNCNNKHALLIGSNDPVKVDLQEFSRRIALPAIHQDLKEISLEDPLFLLSSFMLDKEGMLNISGKSPVNTDDHPVLEFSDFKNLVHSKKSWAVNLSKTIQYRKPLIRFLEDSDPSPSQLLLRHINNLDEANMSFLQGVFFDLTDNMDTGSSLKRALTFYPFHPGTRYLYQHMGEGFNASRKEGGQLETLMVRGLNFFKYGLSKKAEEMFREALKLDPSSSKAHNNLGNVLYRRGSLKEAKSEYEEALRLNKKSFESLTNLGNICLREGEYDSAVSYYAEALKINPSSAIVHNNLGTAYKRTGKTEKATEYYLTAIELDKDFQQARENLRLVNQNLPN